MHLSIERKKDLYFILAFAGLVIIFFWRVIFLGGAFPGGDIINQFHPWKQFLVDQMKTEGRVPLWNPYTFSGNPFAANFQIGIWYPLDILFFFMPVVDAFRFSVVLHFFLSCLFMYVLARHFKLSHWSSFIAGLLFTFSGFMVTRMYAGNYTLVTTYPWIPIIFYFFDRLLQTNQSKYLVFFAICISCQILGGHPQPAYYTWLLLFLYAVFQVGFRKHDKESWQKSLQPIGWYLLCVLLVAGLTAIQLLPTYELSHYSSARAGGAPYKFATSSSLSWRHLLLFFTPYLFGTPLDDTYWLDNFGYVETCGFTGILAVLLVIYTLIAVRSRKVLFWGTVLFLSFFLGFGKYNLVYPILFNIIPGIKLFRCPGRWLMMVNFAIAVIVPLGLDYLWYSKDESIWKTYKKYLMAVMVGGILVLGLYAYIYWNTSHTIQYLYKYQVKVLVEEFDYTTQEAIKMIPDDAMPNRYEIILQKYQEFMVIYLVVFLVLLFFYYKRRHPLQTWLVAGIVLLELWNWGGNMLQSEPRDKYLHRFQHSPEMQAFQQDKSIYRIADMDSMLSWKYTTEEFEFRPNRLMMHQLQEVRGYDPTILKYYAEYLNILSGFPLNQSQGGICVLGETPAFSPPLLGLLNAKYVNSIVPLSLDYLGEVHSGRFLIYQNQEYYPRAFFVPNAMVIPDKTERANLMHSASFCPREYLILESKPQDVPADVILQDTVSQATSLPAEVILKEYHVDVQTYQANLPQKGFVYFSEIWYPGWKLTANGKEIPILRVNHTFRGAYLPPGKYLLKMEFLPTSFYWGKRVTELVILLCVILLIMPFFRKKFHR